ncbi:hypothetical protein BLNAU_18740 [Blattamonas nauphoetae]|uniref:TmcB/TmcC TPR repeats domain-containing protein n=1 Tax=Blattamonas nauphoetae TaxID=2049346 RepID=A0ABQ9X3N9_9EUKA|nr:hypothetical protein BLNAU_18740 [Blattamonas nauphoetae]
MERKTSAQGGQNSQGVSFKLIFAKATKAHDMSRTYLQQAYLLLSKENMDLDRIMLFLDKAIGFERDSRDVYQLLLRQYPNSAQVIRGYGALLRDIYRDDDTTMLMFTEANIIEEDTTLTETMSRVSGGSKLSSIAGRSSGQQKKEEEQERLWRHSPVGRDKTALLPLFIHIVIMSGIVIVGTMVAISSAGIHERDLHGQHQSHQQSVREESNHAPRGTGRSVPGSFGDALIFDDGIRRHPHHHPTQVVNMNLIDLVNNIANVAALIIINEGFWNTVEWPGLPAQLYFVIKNGPYVDIAVGGASVVHHLIVLIVQYVQTINKLKRERREDDVLKLKLRLDETEVTDEELELNTERGQVNDDETMKMMLISQGMNPQMIAMMQIAEMMGKKNQDDEENEEDENEKKNELKDGEKVETKSLKAKREAEEEEK